MHHGPMTRQPRSLRVASFGTESSACPIVNGTRFRGQRDKRTEKKRKKRKKGKGKRAVLHHGNGWEMRASGCNGRIDGHPARVIAWLVLPLAHHAAWQLRACLAGPGLDAGCCLDYSPRLSLLLLVLAFHALSGPCRHRFEAAEPRRVCISK